MVHRDLGEYWKKNPPLSGDVVVMLAQILQALSYLHQKQTTHRDIKPSNILVHSTGPFIAKLADFGLFSTKYLSKTFCAGQLYLAPEAFEAKHNKDRKVGFHWYDRRVDIWSLGIVGPVLP
jgi:serine/threonine protein kinase